MPSFKHILGARYRQRSMKMTFIMPLILYYISKFKKSKLFRLYED